jgi:hypothetical protein
VLSAVDVRQLALLHLAFTLAMVGLMSTVQFVIYPQYRGVPSELFSDYVASHGNRIVIPLALFAPAEVLLALLLWLRAPDGTTKVVLFLAGALLALGWITTIVWYGPLHGRLITEPYSADRIEQLISTNWFRTVLWWVRGVVAVAVMWDLTRLEP